MGSKRRMVPVFGGLAATATAVGAVPLAHVATAAPAPEAGTDDTGDLGLAQDGTFESCSAYFGFGKDDDEGPNLTGFEVVDASGDDEGGHAVPTDTQVVLVIETEGETIECTPEAVTEEEWAEAMDYYWGYLGEVPDFPDHPVYAYPNLDGSSLDEAGYIEGFGFVTSVGYRVVGVPGEHTLVSPTGVQPLPDHFAGIVDFFDGFFDEFADPNVLAHIEATAGADAAQAWEDALFACEWDFEELEPTDPDLLAAVNAILELIGGDDAVDEASCGLIWDIEVRAADALALRRAAAHIETITLAGPTAPEQPVEPAPAPPAAQPVPAQPSFTG